MNKLKQLFRTRYRIIENNGFYRPQEWTWWYPVWTEWLTSWWTLYEDIALQQIEWRKEARRKPKNVVVYEE